MIKKLILAAGILGLLATPLYGIQKELTINWSYPEDKISRGFRVYDQHKTVVGQFDGDARVAVISYDFDDKCESFYITADWNNPETGVTRESPISPIFTVCLEDEPEAPMVETFIITVKKITGENQ